MIGKTNAIGNFEIPDGATKIPVDNYKTWLLCAGIPDTFGSLANVIASASARATLCNNLNALRYMVRSITTIMPAVLASSDWITALQGSTYCVKTPTMTSDTAPSGRAFADSVLEAGYEAFKAFDKVNPTTGIAWLSANTSLPHVCGFEFASAIYAFCFSITNRNMTANATTQTYAPATFKLRGATVYNGTYEDIQSYTSSDTTQSAISTYGVTAPKECKAFEISTSATANGSMFPNTVSIGELQIYGLNLA